MFPSLYAAGAYGSGARVARQTAEVNRLTLADVKKKANYIRENQKGYLRTGGFYRGMGSSKLGTPVELKFFDTAFDDAVVATGGTVGTSLNLIPQGTEENRRIGRVAFIKKIALRYSVTLPTSTVATATSDTLRFLVVLDRQANGAAATWGDIIKVSGGAANVIGYNNLANKMRFKILMDKVINIRASGFAGNGTANDSGQTMITKSWYKRFKKPMRIEFSLTTGAITEVRSNNIFLAQVAKEGLIFLETFTRIRFTD